MTSEPAPPERARPFDRLLVIACAVAFAWNHRALARTAGSHAPDGLTLDEALYDPTVTWPWLGVVVAGALFFSRREAIRKAIGARPSPVLACAAGGVGLLLLAWSHAVAADGLVPAALIFEGVGFAALMGGRRLVALVAYPLVAVLCVVPWPLPWLHSAAFACQRGTVMLASALLGLVGHAHLAAGDLIVTHDATFQVVEGCSGLKSIQSLALAGVAYADWIGRRGYERAMVIAAAVVAGFAANGLRVLALVLGRVPVESVAHQVYGVIAIGAGVLMLGMLELALARTLFWRRSSPGGHVPGEIRPRGPDPIHARPSMRVRLSASTLAMGLIGVQAAALPDGFAIRAPVENPNIENLPSELGGFRFDRRLVVDDAFLGSIRFAHRIYWAYRRSDGHEMRVFVGLADAERWDVSAYSPRTTIPRSGWLERERLGPAGDGAARGSQRFLLRYDERLTGPVSSEAGRDGEASATARAAVDRGARSARVILVEHVRLGFAPWAAEGIRGWLRLDRVGRKPVVARLVIRVEHDLDSDRAGAELRLRQFAQEVADWYRNAG